MTNYLAIGLLMILFSILVTLTMGIIIAMVGAMKKDVCEHSIAAYRAAGARFEARQ